MIRQLMGLILAINLVGCSAIELGEQNAQATTQAEISIENTVESRIAVQRADKPNLISPIDNIEIADDELSLEWTYARSLAPDERFRVLIAPAGLPLQSISSTNTTSADIEDWIADNPANSYTWQIKVNQLDINNEPTIRTANPSDIGMFSVEDVQAVDVTATLEAIIAQTTDDAQAIETHIAETVTAIIQQTPSPDIESTAEVTPDVDSDFMATSANTSVYGTVPIDNDSLDSITAITFDSAGHMLVSLRAGNIYRLEDTDNDGVADEITLIFEDLDEEIGQVSGIFSQNEVLYIINGSRLSQLRDTDDDGIYETVVQLSESLPANQALLQASNSIIRSSDGRYFTTNVITGEILQLTLTE
jgi:hypothetical protein